MDTYLGQKTTEQKRLQVYVAKKGHVYRVIILKQTADHKLNNPTLRASDAGELSPPLANKLFISLIFLST